ncbi:MAG: hypothetical protein KIT73_02690 [Burkholderiales bacterium]|nr:hypothetical protein [Burkholderiales bacterium]
MAHPASASNLTVPGVGWGDYPERADGADIHRVALHRGGSLLFARRRFMRRVRHVRALRAPWQGLDDRMFALGRNDVQARIAADGLTADAADLCCAFVVEAAARVLGKEAYDCQVFAALAMLDNRLVEMATGEGKSLAVALAAAVGALAGIPVHVLTANDYLVTRDARAFGPLYRLLGLDAAAVVAADSPEMRRIAYRRPIVYVTAKELAFDYLRDRLMHGCADSALQRRARALAERSGPPPLLRGLCMAIVDEADSVLIDEAQMPLVLSAPGKGAAHRAFIWQAFALSAQLTDGEDFTHRRSERRITLTPDGEAKIERLAAHLQPVWKNRRHREDTLVAALTARHVLLRDRDYIVADGEVIIVDAVTGRIAPGRKWTRDLHALVALKEGLPVEADPEKLSQITFQRFFRRYLRFGGMSGTLLEARREIASIYGLDVITIPTRLPGRRAQWPTRCFVDDDARWRAVVARVRELSMAGRPVLVGTDSVGVSQLVSERLDAEGVRHVVLNANFDRNEADIVARAGHRGQVTVSTNMAGRGTDIQPDPAALAAGGLHVLCCQHNESRRHDRQLSGRAGRQGQPGSSESWLCLARLPLADTAAGRIVASFLRRFVRDGEVRLPGRWLAWIVTVGQARHEQRQASQRRQLFRRDCEFERELSFTASRE